jgi:methionyl-tRNA formyltransferase
MKLKSIILAGDNLGLSSIYLGLHNYAEKIYIHTNTPQAIQKRANDEFIGSFFDVEEKLVLCSAYAPLIKKSDLEKKEFLNIHYGLLPRFRGMHPVVWGILSDEKELGFTLHKIDEFMDSGPVIFQYKTANDGISTAPFYMNHLTEKVQELIGQAVIDYVSGKIKPRPQDRSKAAWGARRNLNDCKLDFSFTHHQIRNFFRALSKPYPLPFIEFKGVKYFIEKYRLHDQNISALTLGRVVNIDADGIWIKVKEGYLNAQELSDENGAKVDVTKIFRIGSRLDA